MLISTISPQDDEQPKLIWLCAVSEPTRLDLTNVHVAAKPTRNWLVRARSTLCGGLIYCCIIVHS